MFSKEKRHFMEINIRKATADDYNSMCELFDEVDALHRDHLPRLFQKPGGVVREQDYYLGLFNDENMILFVAETGHKLVGFIYAMIRETPAFPIFVSRRFAVVDSIGVKHGFQNHGIGRHLMEHISEWAIEKGATSIELNVYEFNKTAISFYESLGYETISQRMSKSL